MAKDEEASKPSISVGFPNPALESADVPLDLNQLVVSNPTSTFYMRIKGEDWLEQGINPGDIVVIDRSIEPRRNHLVIVAMGGELSITRYDRLSEETQLWGVITHIIHKVK